MARDRGIDVYRGLMWVLLAGLFAATVATGSWYPLIVAAVPALGLYAVRHPA